MTRCRVVAVACAAAVAVACGGRDDDRTRPVNETPQFGAERTDIERPVGTSGEAGHGSDGDARHFAEQAAKGGAAEVELGRLAVERAQSAEVKQFARMMVDDHTRSGNELKQVAGANGLALVGEMPDDKAELMGKLRQLSGAEFDRQYMDAMVTTHRDKRGMVSGRIDEARRVPVNSALETAVNQWASKALPTVEHHLAQAEQILQRLDAGRR